MIRVMSFNVRTQTPHDEKQQFIFRADFLCSTIRRLCPDMIGIQELTPFMRGLMIERLPEYAFVGGGRETDRLGESPCIAFLQKKWMAERLSTEILSLTPHIPGTTFGLDQSPCPRAFSSCDFMPVDGGTPVRVMNIHTDHVGVRARELEISQLLQFYHAQQALRPMPTLITGDFNALPDSEEMKLLMDHACLRDISASVPGTFHDYDRKPPQKIDYIFACQSWSVQRVWTLHEKQNGLFLSDHDPIIADLSSGT